MKLAQFLTTHRARSKDLMWFLGAGASSSAGVPTAGDMIWDFKRTLFSIRSRMPVRLLSDLGNPLIRQRIQQGLDAAQIFPSEGSDQEYARYFEEVYPSEADRRGYIERLISSSSPAYGHLALAALAKLGKAHVIWTTNFDRVIEDATFNIFGTTKSLIVATLDKPNIAIEALHEARFPLLGKLHGDFQSRRLKNIETELQSQDEAMRMALIESCKRFGLVVIGYSGRDHSVMSALESALDGGRGYPKGIFWCHRSDAPPVPAVVSFFERARQVGIQAELVEVETFDELMADILNLIDTIPSEIAKQLASSARRISDSPGLEGTAGFPLVRLNAIRVISTPTVCRRITCDIGGAREVKAAVAKAGSNIVFARRNVGILAFGSDDEITRTFRDFKIKDFDLHSIEPIRLTYDSAELGLLYGALLKALTRGTPLIPLKKHNRHMLVVDHRAAAHPKLAPLRAAASTICGEVRSTKVRWAEGVVLRLESYANNLWLVIEPTVWSDSNRDTIPEHANITKDFIRTRRAERFNQSWNKLFEAWLSVLFGSEKEVNFSAFAINDGVDASFCFLNASAYSPRLKGR